MPRRQTTDVPPHPAPFSVAIADDIVDIIEEHRAKLGRKRFRIIDPFAGVGWLLDLLSSGYGHSTVGIEIEPEWAAASLHVEQGDSTNLRFRANSFDIAVTSPCYGNRFADHHNARDPSHRRTYRHYLGHEVSENSAGKMQWGKAYRKLHRKVIRELIRVVKPGGLIIWNISNHIRGGEEQMVSEWFMKFFLKEGCFLQEVTKVKTPGYRYGTNRETRTEFEFVMVFRVP